jgi:feruloyl-CoA synthase
MLQDRRHPADVRSAPLRPARYWQPAFEVTRRADGNVYVRQLGALGDVPRRISDVLAHWARETPDATFLADRGPDGAWRRLTYAGALDSARRLGQVLLDHGLGPEHPLVILSGNDLEHALLALAAIHVGVPYAPVSEAYSLVSQDHGKLREIVDLLEPGLVFAADGARFAGAIADAVPAATPLLVARNPVRGATLFADAAVTTPTAAVDAAVEKVGPETIAKFLFTSGSTGAPKAVINTNGMICASQMMVRDCYAFMQDESPVVLDWAPWNHTAGGNKVFFMVLFNGGTLYIDDGRPTPEGMHRTIRNLKEVAPTWYFNVPKGYEELIPAFEADRELRERFFSRVKMLMYAGAGLAQHTWDDLQRLSVETTGTRVLVAAGLGATETSPFALMCTWEAERAGNVGVPARGLVLKLVPVEDKLDARLKGPSITPGYWKHPELTAAAFDEEGFYILGDALRFADPADIGKGFYFDGRTAENFKLRTGTWVNVGQLRAQFVNAFEGLARDVALTGLDEAWVGGLVVPDVRSCQLIAGRTVEGDVLFADPAVRAAFAEKLRAFAARSTGSSTLVQRIILLPTPLEIDKGEVTDKGSLNQRAVLRHRAGLVAELYAGSPRVIDLGGAG